MLSFLLITNRSLYRIVGEGQSYDVSDSLLFTGKGIRADGTPEDCAIANDTLLANESDAFDDTVAAITTSCPVVNARGRGVVMMNILRVCGLCYIFVGLFRLWHLATQLVLCQGDKDLFWERYTKWRKWRSNCASVLIYSVVHHSLVILIPLAVGLKPIFSDGDIEDVSNTTDFVNMTTDVEAREWHTVSTVPAVAWCILRFDFLFNFQIDSSSVPAVCGEAGRTFLTVSLMFSGIALLFFIPRMDVIYIFRDGQYGYFVWACTGYYAGYVLAFYVFDRFNTMQVAMSGAVVRLRPYLLYFALFDFVFYTLSFYSTVDTENTRLVSFFRSLRYEGYMEVNMLLAPQFFPVIMGLNIKECIEHNPIFHTVLDVVLNDQRREVREVNLGVHDIEMNVVRERDANDNADNAADAAADTDNVMHDLAAEMGSSPTHAGFALCSDAEREEGWVLCDFTSSDAAFEKHNEERGAQDGMLVYLTPPDGQEAVQVIRDDFTVGTLRRVAFATFAKETLTDDHQIQVRLALNNDTAAVFAQEDGVPLCDTCVADGDRICCDFRIKHRSSEHLISLGIEDEGSAASPYFALPHDVRASAASLQKLLVFATNEHLLYHTVRHCLHANGFAQLIPATQVLQRKPQVLRLMQEGVLMRGLSQALDGIQDIACVGTVQERRAHLRGLLCGGTMSAIAVRLQENKQKVEAGRSCEKLRFLLRAVDTAAEGQPSGLLSGLGCASVMCWLECLNTVDDACELLAMLEKHGFRGTQGLADLAHFFDKADDPYRYVPLSLQLPHLPTCALISKGVDLVQFPTLLVGVCFACLWLLTYTMTAGLVVWLHATKGMHLLDDNSGSLFLVFLVPAALLLFFDLTPPWLIGVVKTVRQRGNQNRVHPSHAE